MSELTELKASLLIDGVIEAAEAKKLETLLFSDGRIDKEEAEFLFVLSDVAGLL